MSQLNVDLKAKSVVGDISDRWKAVNAYAQEHNFKQSTRLGGDKGALYFNKIPISTVELPK